MNLLYTHRIEVRFADCDPLGHVNNAVYLSYLEQARFGLWRRLWGFTGETATTAAGGAGLIMARAECDYRLQATYGDVLDVRLGLAAIGRTSFTYEYEIVDVATGRVVAQARTVQVLYDYAQGRPVPIDEARRADLSKAVETP
ncbi:MAG TPA: thioesterase family protein [Vicinamibacterales bacterium]